MGETMEADLRNASRDVTKDMARYERSLSRFVRAIKEARQAGMSDERISQIMSQGVNTPEDRKRLNETLQGLVRAETAAGTEHERT